MPDALLELGSLYESSRRLAEAAHAYKRLLIAAPDDDGRALAIWRLAHVYEARKLFVAARDSYLDLQARFPKVHLREADREATVAELVAAELAAPVRSAPGRWSPTAGPTPLGSPLALAGPPPSQHGPTIGAHGSCSLGGDGPRFPG